MGTAMEAPFTPEKIEEFLLAEALPFELVPLGVVGDLKAKIERLRTALSVCADGYTSPECTVVTASGYLLDELKRRSQVASQALG